ncbi:uncharacterized protein N7469_002869 [Penicillium citrinum]|uniref:Uncharacterized protein n=2 Tax=Penicillium TaxID=5073 RepID=A0A9W9PB51_PENCI|nr:uncharacterized protein N7469_002869 [Penicillium citrinum]KAJ5241278.1 hypothetical protein N7469_002869 [Penicillium citrinum]KAJ5586279.1 hypothetical protein N7450_006066 [Penicillium hetheringtonii]
MSDPISNNKIIASLVKYTNASCFALKCILEHISAQTESYSKVEELGLSDHELLAKALARTEETPRYPVEIPDIEDAITKYMHGDQTIVLVMDAPSKSCPSEAIKRSLIRLLNKFSNLRIFFTGTIEIDLVEGCQHIIKE